MPLGGRGVAGGGGHVSAPARCDALLVFYDDTGVNPVTCSCAEPLGHAGRHGERGRCGDDGPQSHDVAITWEGDDRSKAAGA